MLFVGKSAVLCLPWPKPCRPLQAAKFLAEVQEKCNDTNDLCARQISMLEKQTESQGVQIAERVDKMGRDNKAELRDGLDHQRQVLEATVNKFREQQEASHPPILRSCPSVSPPLPPGCPYGRGAEPGRQDV